ncbi:hypothetical protein PUN28_005280 [Cardiocondyla obscurior]|uniref:Uncharacterized protein n=1 Tax=Cardiocondyla obscurior TaxID=286306 RepID=A0AAW2GGN4_9HYME
MISPPRYTTIVINGLDTSVTTGANGDVRDSLEEDDSDDGDDNDTVDDIMVFDYPPAKSAYRADPERCALAPVKDPLEIPG